MKNPNVLILLLNWNGKKDTLECIDSLKKLTYPHCFILVVDNGSSDGSVPALRHAYPSIHLIETGENLGFAGGNNVGIQFALERDFDWILLLNNDTVVAPDLIERLLEIADQKKAHIVGPKILRYHEPSKIDHLGGYFDPKTCEFVSPESGQIDDGIRFEEPKEPEYICGCALLMHRCVPQTIGLLEPQFFLLWEETDFCKRASRAGFRLSTAPLAKIWHKVSASFSGGKPHMQYFWWRSRLLFVSRNFSSAQKKELYKTVLLSEIFRFFKFALLKAPGALLFPSKRQKWRRYLAGCAGIYHYAIGRFGNAPSWVLRK
jgi:GT2 family glycosyltransferase